MAAQFIFGIVLVLFSAGMALAESDPDVVHPNDLNTKLEVEEEKSKKEEVKVESDYESTQAAKDVEKIQVTGSYVRRIDIEGPSPVVTVEKEDFEKAGVDTVSDYLRESNLFTGSTDSGNRDGYFRFRGQSAASTLVLINGLRVPKLAGPGRGFYAGVESIPTAVIERVEILKDGSSALYGSDAMAGVMNFITKKDYDGAEFSTRVNVPEINVGIQQNHTLAFGKQMNRGNWFATAQFVEQRGYTELDSRNRYNHGVSVLSPQSQGSWTTYDSQNSRSGQSQNIEPNCVGDNSCEIDYRGINYVREPRQNLGTLLSGRVEVTPDIELNMVGMYNRRSRTEMGRPDYLNISRQSGDNRIAVSQLGSDELQSNSNGDPFAELNLMPYQELGSKNVAVTQNSYSAQTGLTGYFFNTWKWDLSGSYAYSLEERNHRNGLISKQGVVDAMVNSGYNPLSGGSTNRNLLASAEVQGVEAYEASFTNARMVASGELFDMNQLWGAGGPFSVAIGVEGQWERSADVHDEVLTQSDLNTNIQPNLEGSRNVASVFSELVFYPLNSLEVQIAGRLDSYSDWGDTFNPKISMGYRPSNSILLRSSWGTNFRTPSVRDMIERDRASFEDLQFCDPNDDACDSQNLQVTRYRQENLKPEQGINYNFGTVIQPNRKWSFTIDQWNFEGTETLSAISDDIYSDIYGTIFDGNLSSTDASIENYGVEIDRDPQGNIITARIPILANMGSRTIRGLDLGFNFGSPIRLFNKVFKFNVNFSHTHMLVYKEKRAPQLSFVHRQDLEWKNTLGTTLATKNHSYRVAVRTLAGDTTRFSQTRTHTEYDLNYNFAIPWWSASLALGVKNLFDRRPPVDRSGNYIDFTDGYNSYAFQALGRRYYVGYSHSF